MSDLDINRTLHNLTYNLNYTWVVSATTLLVIISQRQVCLWYRLNGCAPPPPPKSYGKTNAQCDSIWKWDVGEVIRSRGWSLHEYNLYSHKSSQTREPPCLFCHVKAQKVGCLWTNKWALTKPWICCGPDLGPREPRRGSESLQNHEKVFVVYKPPGL